MFQTVRLSGEILIQVIIPDNFNKQQVVSASAIRRFGPQRLQFRQHVVIKCHFVGMLHFPLPSLRHVLPCRTLTILFLYCFGKRHEHCQLFEKKYFSCLMIKKVIRFVRRKKRILFPRQLYMGNKIRQEFLQPINFPIFYKKNAEKQNFCWTIKEISIINLFSNQCSGSSVGRAED